jgi:hypothetical protein
MKDFWLTKIIVFFFLCVAISILAGERDAFADSVRFDVSPTHAAGLNRYCFQLTNDDKNEKRLSDIVNHKAPISSVQVKYLTREKDAFRDNISNPDGWKGEHKKTQSGPPHPPGTEGTIFWKTDVKKDMVRPGDRSGEFCFVAKGLVIVRQIITDTKVWKLGGGVAYVSFIELGLSGGGAWIEESDADFMEDSDGDGIPDKFDEAPDKKDKTE